MSLRRRTVLTGLAGLGTVATLPAWAQAIAPQSDPWAQVDPYADGRNGPPPQGGGWSDGASWSAGDDGPAPAAAPPQGGAGGASPMAATGSAAPQPPTPEEIAAHDLMQTLTDPERFEILSARGALYQHTVTAPNKQQGGIVRNAAVQRAFQQFCQPFFAVADRRHLPWEVYVTDLSRPNGLAFGGGKLTIAAGTILYADHPAELAGIVAHEIGHNDRRHVSESQEVSALMTLAASGRAELAGGVADALARMEPFYLGILSAGFSRQQEREADAHVPYLFERVGMDANRYVTMFQKMMRIYGIDSREKTCLVDNHPAMMERIELVRAAMVGRGPGREFTPPGWAELKRFYPTPADYQWG